MKKKTRNYLMVFIVCLVSIGLLGSFNISNNNSNSSSHNSTISSNYNNYFNEISLVDEEGLNRFVNPVEKNEYYSITLNVEDTYKFKVNLNGYEFLNYENAIFYSLDILNEDNFIKINTPGRYKIDVYVKDKVIYITSFNEALESIKTRYTYNLENKEYEHVYDHTENNYYYQFGLFKNENNIYKKLKIENEEYVDITVYGYSYLVPYIEGMNYFYITYEDNIVSPILKINDDSISTKLINNEEYYIFEESMFNLEYYGYYNLLDLNKKYTSVTLINLDYDNYYDIKSPGETKSFGLLEKVTDDFYQAFISVEDGFDFNIYKNDNLISRSSLSISFGGYTSSNPSWINPSSSSCFSIIEDGYYYVDYYPNLDKVVITNLNDFEL